MIKEGLLSLTVFYVSLPLMLGLLGWALYGVNWQVLASNRTAQHVFYGSVLLCLPFWLLSAGILPGLHFHLLGMTALTLVMGWRLALLVGFIVQIITLSADRKSTRLNSSHVRISYAVFCLKKKNNNANCGVRYRHPISF